MGLKKGLYTQSLAIVGIMLYNPFCWVIKLHHKNSQAFFPSITEGYFSHSNPFKVRQFDT